MVDENKIKMKDELFIDAFLRLSLIILIFLIMTFIISKKFLVLVLFFSIVYIPYCLFLPLMYIVECK
jgi:hypothetical protein